MYKQKTGLGDSISKTSSSTTTTSEEQGPVWLGVQGKEIRTVNGKEEAVDGYTTKIGGWPVRVNRQETF